MYETRQLEYSMSRVPTLRLDRLSWDSFYEITKDLEEILKYQQITITKDLLPKRTPTKGINNWKKKKPKKTIG